MAVFKRTNILEAVAWGLLCEHNVLNLMVQCPFSQTDDYNQAVTDKMVPEYSGVDM